MSKEKPKTKKAKPFVDPKVDYLRTLYSRYRALLETLGDAMRSSRREHPKQYEDPLGSVSFLNYIKYFVWEIERTEFSIQKVADTIIEGIDNHKCNIAQDAKITIATIYRLNHKIMKPALELKERYLRDMEEDFWDGEEFGLACLYSDALKLQEQHFLIDRFIKDLLITETRILLEIKSTKITKLKKKGAEQAVKMILEDFPDNNWTAVALQQHLAEQNLQYSNVSIGKLKVWQKWLQDNPEGKPEFMRLTEGRLKNIDSTGKTHFSSKKEAERYTKEEV